MTNPQNRIKNYDFLKTKHQLKHGMYNKILRKIFKGLSKRTLLYLTMTESVTTAGLEATPEQLSTLVDALLAQRRMLNIAKKNEADS